MGKKEEKRGGGLKEGGGVAIHLEGSSKSPAGKKEKESSSMKKDLEGKRGTITPRRGRGNKVEEREKRKRKGVS